MYYTITKPSQIIGSTEPSISVVYVDNAGLHWTLPGDERNAFCQQYLAWVAEGNVAEEWDNS